MLQDQVREAAWLPAAEKRAVLQKLQEMKAAVGAEPQHWNITHLNTTMADVTIVFCFLTITLANQL